ncbi:ROK family transcriptional regulator [Anaeromicropila populeti]|uniref:Sugar kinase of the NBD/HSP70 family, may contain an N-terminal HTH domain n=1 Tax=Anaeromicropila populeti TaxID=37658 RepID=A0A1I6HPP2_9FIRM|nr:ROK family transcriptional regulator [Anaeromicropila populeti]SFR56416.1 Sugar kinase of the NBD/HSP70 family, may contain an N-terminal HTH domain [Anaeromicropila populeti]
MITGNKELIRDINSTIVLETIINSEPISRANLSKKLGLTKATISSIVQDLINQNLILEIGSDETLYGRKPILLSFHKRAGVAISIDLGLTITSAVLTNLKGEVLQYMEMQTPAAPPAIVPQLINLVNSMVGKSPKTFYGLIGISIGIHGITTNNRVSFTQYYNLSNIHLAEELEQFFHVPVTLEKEANLSALGEHTYMYHYPNIANINVHNEISLGLVMNHQLYSGFSGYAGELGHIIVERNGRLCACGNRGCIGEYTSIRALMKDYAELTDKVNITINDLLIDYQNNEEPALVIVNQFIEYMTICVNNVVNIFNPDIIVINCIITNYFPEIIDEIESSLKSQMNFYQKIAPSYLAQNSILLGGVTVLVKNFLKINSLKFATTLSKPNKILKP